MNDDHDPIHRDIDAADLRTQTLAQLGIGLVLIVALLWWGTTQAQTITAPTRVTSYDWQCQDADGNKISDHQREGIATVTCLNNPAGAFIQGGRYRVNRPSAPPVEPPPPPPPPPPELTAPTLTATQSPNVADPTRSNVTLTWTAVAGATGYVVERCTGVTCTNFAPLASVVVLAYANNNIPGGLTVRYRVRGVDATRQGEYSAVVSVATPAPPPAPTEPVAFLRINAGGAALDGYEADRSFVGGAVTTNCNRAMSGVFQSRRWANPGFEYRIPVANGTYVVRLLWQECWNNAAGKRVVSANVEGQAIAAFDTWGTDGAVVMHERAVTVADGVLNIALAASVSDAMLNAIEITKTGADPEPPPPTATGSATLTWTPPTTNTDGTLVTLAGFRIRYSTAGAAGPSLSQTIDVKSATAKTYVVDKLTPGPWAFAVEAYDTRGRTSQLSNVATRVVP